MEVGGGAGASVVVNNNEEEEYELAAASVRVDQNMPPGFRFHPTDEEIIIHYLLNKVIDRRFSPLAIGEVDLNNCEPWDLPKKAKMGENEWFFFFQKDRKYATGMRTNRATESGYWKATGKDRGIYNKGRKNCPVGMKKTLVFYKGRAPKGERTNWVMHEYRLNGGFSNYNFSTTATEEWAVCRVFHKKTGTKTVDSSVDHHHLLDSPTLPPLTDYSAYSTETHSSSFATEEADELIKANNILSSELMLNNHQLQMLQHNQNNLLAPPLIISNLNPNPISSYTQINVHPSSVFSAYQSPRASLVYQNQDQLNSTIARHPTNSPIKGADQPDSRNLAPNVYIGGEEPERMCKMETSSFNNSIISHSQDTVLSAEMATEITSVQYSMGDTEIKKPSDQESEGLTFSPSISDLDSLWSY